MTTTLDKPKATYCLPQRPGAVYVNVTDSCLNDCRFCMKIDGFEFFGHDLALRGGPPEPTAILEEIQATDGWPGTVSEVVFCGIGEPLLRNDCVLGVVKSLRAVHGWRPRIRVNTSGLHWVKIKSLELLEYLDGLSVSLNAEGAEKYEALCKPKIPGAYEVLLDFLRAVKRFEEERASLGLSYPEVCLTVVDTSQQKLLPAVERMALGDASFPVPDLDACEAIARGFGWPLVVRPLWADSRAGLRTP